MGVHDSARDKILSKQRKIGQLLEQIDICQREKYGQRGDADNQDRKIQEKERQISQLESDIRELEDIKRRAEAFEMEIRMNVDAHRKEEIKYQLSMLKYDIDRC